MKYLSILLCVVFVIANNVLAQEEPTLQYGSVPGPTMLGSNGEVAGENTEKPRHHGRHHNNVSSSITSTIPRVKRETMDESTAKPHRHEHNKNASSSAASPMERSKRATDGKTETLENPFKSFAANISFPVAEISEAMDAINKWITSEMQSKIDKWNNTKAQE